MSEDFLERKRNEAIAYYEMKRYQQAELAFKEALSLEPEDDSSKLLLANCYYMLERYDEAEKLCGEIITTYLAREAYRLLGKIARENKFYKKSEQCFLKSLELDPNEATTLAEYSYLLLICGYKKKANEVMQNAIELDPNNSNVLHYKYFFEYAHGGKNKENSSIEQYFENSSDEVQKLIMLGLTEHKNKNYKRSKEYFRQAFLLEPTNEYILEMLEELDEVTHFIFFPNRLFSKIHLAIRLIVVPIVVIALMTALSMVNTQLATIFIISFFICTFGLIIWSWLAKPIYNHLIKKKI